MLEAHRCAKEEPVTVEECKWCMGNTGCQWNSEKMALRALLKKVEEFEWDTPYNFLICKEVLDRYMCGGVPRFMLKEVMQHLPEYPVRSRKKKVSN